MTVYRVHSFVDGGHVRELGKRIDVPWPDPRELSRKLVESPDLHRWAGAPYIDTRCSLTRTVYYDGWPEKENDQQEGIQAYWKAIAQLPDTHLGFASAVRRGTRGPLTQKGVDTLLAVDMVVGSFNRIFDALLLITADSDFVPVLEEVRRAGVGVFLAAGPTAREDLKQAADRVVSLPPGRCREMFTPLPFAAPSLNDG